MKWPTRFSVMLNERIFFIFVLELLTILLKECAHKYTYIYIGIHKL